jgi:hypothetical protein
MGIVVQHQQFSAHVEKGISSATVPAPVSFTPVLAGLDAVGTFDSLDGRLVEVFEHLVVELAGFGDVDASDRHVREALQLRIVDLEGEAVERCLEAFRFGENPDAFDSLEIFFEWVVLATYSIADLGQMWEGIGRPRGMDANDVVGPNVLANVGGRLSPVVGFDVGGKEPELGDETRRPRSNQEDQRPETTEPGIRKQRHGDREPRRRQRRKEGTMARDATVVGLVGRRPRWRSYLSADANRARARGTGRTPPL